MLWHARWPTACAVGVLAAALLWTYAPVFTQSYLFSDDYHFALHGPPADWFLSGGRPLQGALYQLMPRDMASPAAAGLRLASTLGLLALGVLLYRQLAALAAASIPRLLMVAAVLALPTFQVATAWLACWPSTVAALLAACSAHLMLTPAGHVKPAAGRWALAAALNLAALCTYQPAAMWYWTVVLVAVLSSDISQPDARRRLAAAALGGGLHLVLYFALIQSLQAWCDVTPVARGALTTDVLGKLGWFVAKPLRNSLNAWNLFKPRWFGVVSLAAIVAGGWIAARSWLLQWQGRGISAARARSWLLLQATLLAACLLCSYLPNLVVVESWASCRSTIALSGSVTLLGLAAAATLARTTGWSPNWLLAARLSAVTAAVGLLGLARWNIVETIIAPQQRERAALIATLDERLHAGIRHVHLVQPHPRQFSAYSEHDEFGLATTATGFGARAMLTLALRQCAPRRDLEISYGATPPESNDPATLTIDLRAAGRK